MKLISILLISFTVALAEEAVQTDWSGGIHSGGAVAEWATFFAESSGISTSAVPGILSLSSIPLTTALETVVDDFLPLSRLAAGDLNGDGFADLVGTSLVSGHVHWFQNTDGEGWITVPLEGDFSGALGCDICDIDGDGYPDVIGAVEEPDMIVYWKNDGGSGPGGNPIVVDSLFPGAHCVVGCDADGDGMNDIIGAANECDQIAVWYNLGGDSFEKVIIDPDFEGTQSVSAGDIDGDGLVDVAGASMDLAEFAWWENPGNRSDSWLKASIAGGMTYAHHAVVVDINGDEFADLLATSFGQEKILWYENNGTGSSWEPHTIAPALQGAVTAVAADFDGDGDMDAAGAGWGINRLMWYENTDGIGENWRPRLVAAGFKGAWALVSGDFDNNGRLELAAGGDVLGGTGPSHGVSLFDLCEFGSSGFLTGSVLDTQESPCWAGFEFEAEKPAGTDIVFYWKSSNDPGNMGEWIGPFTTWTELSGELYRYVQYKVEFTSDDVLVSPVLFDISLYWDPNGINHGDTSGNPTVFLEENPVFSGNVHLLLPEGGTEVTILDTSGRRVGSGNSHEPGERMDFGCLPAGAYLVRAMNNSGNESVLKMLVL